MKFVPEAQVTFKKARPPFPGVLGGYVLAPFSLRKFLRLRTVFSSVLSGCGSGSTILNSLIDCAANGLEIRILL